MKLKEDSPYKPHNGLIKAVKDYAKQGQRRMLDGTKTIQSGWEPKETFESSLRKTIQWYLYHMPWVENVVSGDYKDWIHAEYTRARYAIPEFVLFEPEPAYGKRQASPSSPTHLDFL